MGLLVGLVEATVEAAAEGRDADADIPPLTWVDVHKHLIERCNDKTAGPVVFLIVNYLRRADIGFIIRDAERAEVDPMLGWAMYKLGHKLALNHIFPLHNAFKYIRHGVDEQREWAEVSSSRLLWSGLLHEISSNERRTSDPPTHRLPSPFPSTRTRTSRTGCSAPRSPSRARPTASASTRTGGTRTWSVTSVRCGATTFGRARFRR